jgi:hypothetical protein
MTPLLFKGFLAPKDLGALDSCDEHRNEDGWEASSPDLLLAKEDSPIAYTKLDDRLALTKGRGVIEVAGADPLAFA